MKKILMFSMMFLLLGSIFATTTVTIDAGGTGDYLSFTECFTDLTTLGIDGPLNVEVMAGTYVESATINGAIPGADEANPVHIYPVDGDVIIDGGGNLYTIGLVNTGYVYLEDLSMKLDGFNEFCNGVLYLENSTNIDISHCEIYDSGFVGLLAQNSQDLRIWNNFIYDTNAVNVSLAMCGMGSDIEIWNNSLHYNNPYFGGFFGPPAQCLSLNQSSANVHNNVLFKDVDDSSPMGSFGIINIELMGGVMSDYYTADSFNNNCYYTVEGNTLFQVGYMEAYTNLADLTTAYGFATSSVFGDPEYVDAANGDLDIATATSVCFAGGATPARWFSDDINYETRTRWDIGADFIAPAEYIISGSILTSDQIPLANVTLTGINTDTNTFITGDDGTYSFTALAGYDVTITPDKEGYDFEPETLVVNNINSEIIQDFTAAEWDPNSPMNGIPQGDDIPVNTSSLSWSHPESGITPTMYIVTMSNDNIPVEGFNEVEVIYPLNYLQIPAGTLLYDTQYQVEVVANYTAPARNLSDIAIAANSRGDSNPLIWDFTTENRPNTPPIADAGDDDAIYEGTVYMLDGTGSYDAEFDDLTYSWTAPDGIVLDDPNSSTPVFTSPMLPTNESIDLIFSLVVDDQFYRARAQSQPDEVVITIININQQPIADAGEPQTVYEGDQVSLDGSGSYDIDSDELIYFWTAPEGVSLSNPTVQMPTFTAPELQPGETLELIFTLVVNDQISGTRIQSIPDDVVITVLNYIEPDPVCAVDPFPEYYAVNVDNNTEIGWTYIHDPDYSLPEGFRILMADNIELTDAYESYVDFSGEGEYLQTHPVEFNYEMQYYWQVIPTNNTRDDAIDCPVWTFITEATPIYTVSGFIGIGAEVDLGNGQYSNIQGDYELMVFEGEDITLTPALDGFDFTPETVTFENIHEDIQFNFDVEMWCPDAPTNGLPVGLEVEVDYPELTWDAPVEGVTPNRYFVTLSDHPEYMNSILYNEETSDTHFSLNGWCLDYNHTYYIRVYANYTPELWGEEGCNSEPLEWSFTTQPDVGNEDDILPIVTELLGNYPNPFNPTTTIHFSVANGDKAELIIFNLKGQVIESIQFEEGFHNFEWVAIENSTGVYFYTLRSGIYSQTKKMIMLK